MLPDGSEQLVEGEIVLPFDATAEEKNQQKAYLLGQLREEAKRIEEQTRQEALHKAQIAAIQAQMVVKQAPAEPTTKEVGLSLP